MYPASNQVAGGKGITAERDAGERVFSAEEISLRRAVKAGRMKPGIDNNRNSENIDTIGTMNRELWYKVSRMRIKLQRLSKDSEMDYMEYTWELLISHILSTSSIARNHTYMLLRKHPFCTLTV
ncbi:uncharacterized protein LOC116846231 isoform X3 [Odontomachus brunneus]|uniref:uncharacterized protein LOC116846231 isoform X3 n=1 Tax=Odontomachus brunneus TaxID=486640 RepID=UPI0013F18DAF|nr:uncharacterized protein LOC116846231 isoform X3 [Odontomachus brunneus]